MSLTLIVSPISGGLFVSQIATITAILETGVKVDAYFGNSGGAITNLLALKFNMSNPKNSMLRSLLRINKSMFTKPLVSTTNPLSPILSPLISLFSSHLNKNGSGVLTLISELFTESELKSTEFWIGRYNIKGNYNELVCSKSQSDFFELDINYLRNINGTYNISYIDGEIEQIANAIGASISIPSLIPPSQDNNNLYWDGGIAMASPFTAFVTSWYKKLVATNEKAQIWYNMGSNYIDSDIEYFNESAHWSKHLLTTIKWMINFTIQRERQVVYDMWSVIVDNNNKKITTVKKTGKELKTFYPTIQDKYYFITCYSSVTGINLTTFTQETLKKEYNEAYDSTTFEISYTLN